MLQRRRTGGELQGWAGFAWAQPVRPPRGTVYALDKPMVDPGRGPGEVLQLLADVTLFPGAGTAGVPGAVHATDPFAR